MALVTIDNLSVKLGNRLVIDGFSASLSQGTITAILGPNGSGKSTLLSAIAGDLKIFEGVISINGLSVNELSLKSAAGIRSVVSQSRNYWLSYSVREVIAMGQDEQAIARVDQVLEELDMHSYAAQKVTTLSGGQAQRVEIARALIRNSELYLLDEPFSAQDWQSRDRIIAILQELKNIGKTILLITHGEASSLTWCDQIFDLGA